MPRMRVAAGELVSEAEEFEEEWEEDVNSTEEELDSDKVEGFL